ncbi:mannose-6-phosphate isomerase [Brevundimonas bullata]|uniref:Mannose-6-phosphate isomerase n=1 Tax=Brevundimonas bullata TaxID=13160 RepID=A0A7W7IPK1_9CAUL|nr:AGE family epimerase/isomerase [Brevundimonas bullata]MBB4798186.1 mannose-6-phosphate isomerase [Brevundimonas bullata]MBB6383500.1 mannose-6-phosphate isomerase [Brevundimonas bullata]
MTVAELKQVQTQARDWLINIAAPFWSDAGRTPSGLYAERLDRQGQPNTEYYRTFVQARQIFSFSAACKKGWSGAGAEQVQQTVDCLLEKARRGDGLFVHRLAYDASVLDARADLYDQAFILFGLGAAGDLLCAPRLFDEAERLLDVLEDRWSDAAGGFNEGEVVDRSIRRQNPHMHLLEAFSTLYKVSGRQRFGDAAVSIAELCRTRFIDPDTGALLEYFEQDWRPLADVRGQIAEPGHCLEWAWLFEGLASIWGDEALMSSDRLTAFARTRGIDATRGVAINEVLTRGGVHDDKARLWPQTERMKAAVSRYARTGSDDDGREIINAYRGLEKYFLPDRPELWMDKMLRDGTFLDELVPASSFYHISCGINELLDLDLAGVQQLQIGCKTAAG